MPSVSSVHEFGSFRLDPAERLLLRAGQPISLTPKAFDLLVYLVDRAGRLVTKHELMSALWPDSFVEETNLTFTVSVLRKALGDGNESEPFIQTVPTKGYRFTAKARLIPADQAGVAPPGQRDSGTRRIIWPARGRMKWFVALAGASAFALASYVFIARSRTSNSAPMAVPLTAFDGFALYPSISPDGSQVAFSWGKVGPATDRGIYIKSVGPGEAQRVTRSPGNDFAPAWSPDGRRLAFTRQTSVTTDDLLVVTAEVPALTVGHDERRLATRIYPASPPRVARDIAWTPDGNWIAFGGQPTQEESGGIWLIAVDRDEKRRLTDSPSGTLDEKPAFSADGNRLAFIRRRLDKAPTGAALHVVALSPDLTVSGRPVRMTSAEGLVGGHAWTSDGRGLVFSMWGAIGGSHLHRVAVSGAVGEAIGQPERLAFGQGATGVSISRSGRVVYTAQFRDSAIWKLPVAGLIDRPVAMPLLSSAFDEQTPDFSPDGERITFVSTRSGAEEIWIARADGSNPVQVTSFGARLTSNPRWSRDGKTILFNSRREGSSDLYLVRPDTREFHRLTDEPSDEVGPRWSRDGRWIYFGSDRTGQLEVWRMPAGGGASVRITQYGGAAASESPDSKFLYYAKSTKPTPLMSMSRLSIWRVPLGGGEETPVVSGLSYHGNFVAADQGLYFVAVGEDLRHTSIDFVEYGSGRRTTLVHLGKPAWYGAAVSPDQRSLLFSTIDNFGSNLMLVDTFR